MTLYSDEAAWDMRSDYFKDLSILLNGAAEPALSKDNENWYGILKVIYRRVRPFMNKEEQANMDAIRVKITDSLYSDRDQEDETELAFRQSIVYETLELFEQELLDRMHKHGLLVPRRADPMHAVTQGMEE
jgi:hypothetical protein